jgi:hypothetical protein
MSTSHETFEELCALAAAGQISVAEFTKLQAHLDICAACRGEYADYQDLIRDRLPLAAPSPEFAERLTIAFSQRAQPDDHRRRFISEAQRRGFQFSAEAERGHTLWGRLTGELGANHKLLLIILVLLAVSAISGYRLWGSEMRRGAMAVEVAGLNSQNAALREQLTALSKTLESATAGLNPPVLPDEQDHSRSKLRTGDAIPGAAIEAELAGIREEYLALQARTKLVEEQLQASALQSQTLKSELENSKTVERQIAGQLQEAERMIKEMTGELRNLREGRRQDALLIAAQESRLKDRSDQLREQTQALDQQKELLAVDRDIRDIMTARNLHIIDVSDHDSKGRTRRPLGRIFYTENKSLIFYAFELDDKRVLNSNYAFQAWGYRESNDQTARSLGIFYIDDQKQKRWALKFDDPRILQQIDAVFVTIEPPGGSKKPTGQKLLYAYLKGKPNHP